MWDPGTGSVAGRNPCARGASPLPTLVGHGWTAAFLFRCLTCGTLVAYYDMG